MRKNGECNDPQGVVTSYILLQKARRSYNCYNSKDRHRACLCKEQQVDFVKSDLMFQSLNAMVDIPGLTKKYTGLLAQQELNICSVDK